MKRNYKNWLDKIEKKLDIQISSEVSFTKIEGLYTGYNYVKGKRYKDISEKEFKELSKKLEAQGFEISIINIVRAKEPGNN